MEDALFTLENGNDDDQLSVGVIRQILAEKDTNLQLAAEFGNELIGKNAVLDNEISTLEERINARNAEMEHLYNQIADLQTELTLLQKTTKNNNVDTPSRSVKEDESFELKSLRQKYNLANDQLKDAANTNMNLMNDIEQKNEQLARYKTIEKELKQYRSENEKLHLQKEKNEQSINELNQERNDLKRDLRKAQENLKISTEKQYTLEGDIVKLKQSSATKDDPSKRKISKLEERLVEAEELIQEQETKITELSWEKKKLEQVMTATAVRNMELEKEKKEHLRFLDEARASVSKYRQREEDQTLELSMDLADKGLLSELEKELDLRIDGDKQSKETKPKEEKDKEKTKAPPIGAPENCEDYFFLAVTAIKISCAMKAPVGSAGAFRVNTEQLYEQCLDAEIPFHEWYEWVKSQFDERLQNYLETEAKIRGDYQPTPPPEPEPAPEPDSLRARFARFMKRT